MVWLLMVVIVWFSQLIQWQSCLVEDKVEAEHRELVLASCKLTADAVKFPAGESCLLARLCDAGKAARPPFPWKGQGQFCTVEDKVEAEHRRVVLAS